MGLQTGLADHLHLITGLHRSLRTAYEHHKAVCKLLVGIVNIIIIFKWGAGLGWYMGYCKVRWNCING